MSFMHDLESNVLGEFVAAFILLVLAFLRAKFSLALAKADPRLPIITFFVISFSWLVVNLSALLFGIGTVPLAILLVCTSSAFFYFSWRELKQFWGVGLRGADEKISSGIDYDGALGLCHNYLDFLGIGAAKLTREGQKFEAALLRCRQDVPIRFLLLSPAEDTLKLAAKRAGRMEDEYKKIVLTSMHILADLKSHRGLNIEVRFYREVPVFRLMFIDHAICLVSYNILGEGDGSQLPQLHVLKPPENLREISSFYHPFELYFNKLWAASEPWDFVTHL